MGISEQPNTLTYVFFPFILIFSYTLLNLRKMKKIRRMEFFLFHIFHLYRLLPYLLI